MAERKSGSSRDVDETESETGLRLGPGRPEQGRTRETHTRSMNEIAAVHSGLISPC